MKFGLGHFCVPPTFSDVTQEWGSPHLYPHVVPMETLIIQDPPGPFKDSGMPGAKLAYGYSFAGLWGAVLTSACHPFWEPDIRLGPRFLHSQNHPPPSSDPLLSWDATSLGSYSPHAPSPGAAHPSIIQSSGLNEDPLLRVIIAPGLQLLR